MKKRILLLTSLMTLGFAAFLSSCGKEEYNAPNNPQNNNELTCVCDIYDEWWNGSGWSSQTYNNETFDQDDLDDYRVDDCDELEDFLYEEFYDGDGDDDDIRCKED